MLLPTIVNKDLPRLVRGAIVNGLVVRRSIVSAIRGGLNVQVNANVKPV